MWLMILVAEHHMKWRWLSADLPPVLDARTSGLAIEADHTSKQISTSATIHAVSCGLY